MRNSGILSNCLPGTCTHLIERDKATLTPAECDPLPPDNFCLLLSGFDVSGQPNEPGSGLDSAGEADEISNDDGAVPEMPSFPLSLVSYPTTSVYSCLPCLVLNVQT